MELFNPYAPQKKKRRKKPGPKPKPKQPPKKRGRKKIPRQFDQVPLGYHIRLQAPLEYDLIMEVIGSMGVPDGDLIEAVSYSSANPFFKTEKFRKLLIQYRQYGCHTEHPKRSPTPQTILNAINRRKNIAKGQK